MKRSSPKPVNLLELRAHRSAKTFRSAIAVVSLLVPCSAPAQTQPHHPPPTQKTAPAPTELDKRLAAARVARDSGNPAAAQSANERLIAVALSELAGLRMAEQAYPQAVDLYSSSLHFEDVPSTRLDLATAEIQAGKTSPRLRSKRPPRNSSARERPDPERGLRTGCRTIHANRTCAAEC